MRGLRLFVRPITPADHPAVAHFLGQQECPISLPETGLLGKLLGDIVALVALDELDDALRVSQVVVARELRRKWIGKAMMREVERHAAGMNRRRVVVDDVEQAAEFFRRVGFEIEGERWVRSVYL